MKFNVFLYFFLLAHIHAMGIKPVREYVAEPGQYGISYVEKFLHLDNGSDSIITWTYDPMPGYTGKTIILAGGDAGNMSYFIYYANQLASRGLRVITFDYRGFGSSSDIWIDTNDLFEPEFTDDLSIVVSYAQSVYPDDLIGVYAFSMGTIMAQLAFSENAFDFLVAEGLVYDPVAYVERLNKNDPGDPVSLDEGYRHEKWETMLFSEPAFLISGASDTFTTVGDSLAFLEKNPNCQLLVYQGGHGAGSYAMGESYFDHVLAFIRQVERRIERKE